MWDQIMRVNMKGPFLCTKEIIPDMLAAQWGRIINISSSSAQTGAKAMSHYVASKGGVIGFTKALAIEFAPTGITVNHVPPGFVDTQLPRESPGDVDAYSQAMPMQRPGWPNAIHAAVDIRATHNANPVTSQAHISTGRS